MCEYAIIRPPGLKYFSLSKLIIDMEEGSFWNAHLTCIKYIVFNLVKAALWFEFGFQRLGGQEKNGTDLFGPW